MNILFPGRPDYTGPTVGHFGLLHHDKLYEHSHDVAERIKYVKAHKPLREIGIRLHNMIYLGGAFSAKCDSLHVEILAYIKSEIPDCVWDGKELDFNKDQK